MPSRPYLRQRRTRRPTAVLAVLGVIALSGCDASENADVDRGRALFQSKCGTCHKLAQAGTSADIGPDLDAAFQSARAAGMDNDTIEGVVQTQIANPREVEEGVPNYTQLFMPQDLVVEQDAEDVSAYVASVAGVPGAAPPQLSSDQLFTERCGSCHVLAAAGTAGNVGPNLDEVLVGKNADPKYVRQQIVDPASEITPGFPDGVMPQDFEQSLSPEDLDGLVEYIVTSLGGGSAK